MKLNNIYFLLAIFLFMSCHANSNQKDEVSKDKSKTLISDKKSSSKNNLVKVYSLKKKDDTAIGDIYVRYINDSIFTDLYVVNNSDTLYSIERNILANKKGRDIEVLNDGFYGYIFVLKRNDYFVLTYLRNKGANVSDDITIEWNYEGNILEKQKLP